MSPEAAAVLSVLRAEELPIRGRAIAWVVGLSSEKRVADAVAELRNECGFVIVAGQDGYSLAQTEAEKREWLEALDARIAGLCRTRRNAMARNPELAQLLLEV